MTRLNLVLLVAAVAVRAVAGHVAPPVRASSSSSSSASRRATRALEVEHGQLSLEQSTWSMPARVEKVAREQLRMQRRRPAASRSSTFPEREAAMRSRRPRAADAQGRGPAICPAVRAAIVFGGLALLFAMLAGRSLYLQGVDNEFLQERGAARYSRDARGAGASRAHRRPPRRAARDLDAGQVAVGVSRPARSDRPARGARALARCSTTTPAALRSAHATRPTTSSTSRSAFRPRSAERALALRIKGAERRERVPPLLPGRRGDGPRAWASPATATPGRKASSSRSRRGSAGVPGSRRVIINRRGDVVEDVAAIRAPQDGRDLALAIDSRLQYLAFRELKAAVERTRRRPAGSSSSTRSTGEILALANWPAYNPNARRPHGARPHAQPRADRRVRAGLDAEAVHRSPRRSRPASCAPTRSIDDRRRHADDRRRDDPRRACRRAR